MVCSSSNIESCMKRERVDFCQRILKSLVVRCVVVQRKAWKPC